MTYLIKCNEVGNRIADRQYAKFSSKEFMHELELNIYFNMFIQYMLIIDTKLWTSEHINFVCSLYLLWCYFQYDKSTFIQYSSYRRTVDQTLSHIKFVYPIKGGLLYNLGIIQLQWWFWWAVNYEGVTESNFCEKCIKTSTLCPGYPSYS